MATCEIAAASGPLASLLKLMEFLHFQTPQFLQLRVHWEPNFTFNKTYQREPSEHMA